MTQPLKAAPGPLLETPYYLPVGNEVELFLAAYRARMPVLLKGPTGCGKTRFLEHMTHRLYRGSEAGKRAGIETSLVTVACHEDLTATDLVGRYLLEGDDTVWMDGPIAGGIGVREACVAAICRAITDDDEVQRAVTEVATTLLP